MNGTVSPGTHPLPVKLPWDVAILSALALMIVGIIQGLPGMIVWLGDSDDALRLVQLRQYLGGASWHDLRIDRMAPPEGYISHWSRIPDAIMASLHSLASLFVTPEKAELFVRIVYPGLWLFPSFVSAACFALAVARHRLAVVVLCVVAGATAGLLSEFAPGRIDHRGAQIALSVLAVAAAALSSKGKWFAWLAGFATVASMAIGLEGLPYVVLTAAVFATRYIFGSEKAQELQSYCVALIVTAVLTLLVARPLSQWTDTACDSFAGNYAAAIFVGGTVLAWWTTSAALNRKMGARLAGVGVGTLAAATVFVFMDASCLRGPFSGIDPELKLRWLDTVQEVQPMAFWLSDAHYAQFFHLVLGLLPALVGALWLLSQRRYRSDPVFIVLVVWFLVAIALALLTFRMYFYAVWPTAIIYTCVLVELFRSLYSRFGKLAYITCLVAVLPAALAVSAKSLQSTESLGGEAESGRKCLLDQDFKMLATLPKGHVLIPVDYGAHVLALTHHSVVAAPYHRLNLRMLDGMRAFETMTPDEVERYVRAQGVSYIAICGGYQPYFSAPTNGQPLSVALMGQGVPAWLVPVEETLTAPMRIYKVKP